MTLDMVTKIVPARPAWGAALLAMMATAGVAGEGRDRQMQVASASLTISVSVAGKYQLRPAADPGAGLQIGQGGTPCLANDGVPPSLPVSIRWSAARTGPGMAPGESAGLPEASWRPVVACDRSFDRARPFGRIMANAGLWMVKPE